MLVYIYIYIDGCEERLRVVSVYPVCALISSSSNVVTVPVIRMEALRYLKNILLPPSKGAIRLRCQVAEGYCITTCCNNEANEDIDEITEEVSSEKGELSRFEKSLFCFRNRINSFFKAEQDKIHKVEELEQDEFYVTSPLDTFIGYAVDVAGSIFVLAIVMALLVGWIVWGALTGATDTWQIVMQDGQSIQTYVWNSFLMRQQLDNNEKMLLLYAKLKSRSLTHKRLLEKFITNKNEVKRHRVVETEPVELEPIDFKNPSLYDKFSEIFGKCVGSLPAVIIYWAGIFTWIGCGSIAMNIGTEDVPNMKKFSDTWQMYVNTATAIELLITTVFLENVRHRTGLYIAKQTQAFNQLDSKFEFELRDLSGDYYENELVVVNRPPRDKIQKAISLYAHVVGNGLGLVISVCVFSAWISIGNTMHWSPNWWLVIGSYTGLVGFIDGFVLREVFYSITNYERQNFNDLLKDSQELLDMAGIQVELEEPKKKDTLSVRISTFINMVCSHEYSVIASFVIVLGLVILASAMRWSETAQLVANTPTMIIEGFFLLILVQAHNWASDERIKELEQLTKSRVLLYEYIKKNG